MENSQGLVSVDTQEKYSTNKTKTYTTKEASHLLGIPVVTLQSWVRNEIINPKTSGIGHRKRIHWIDEDLDFARSLREGTQFHKYLSTAKQLSRNIGKNEFIISGPNGVKVVSGDTTINEAIRRGGKIFIVLT